MYIRFYNARILTMEENDEIIENGQLWIKDEKILYVGDGSDLEDFYQRTGNICIIWDKEIDCNGDLLMPGFKNAHTHSGMTCLRSMADDLPLQEWLENQIFPFEAKLLEDDIYYFTKLAILEYLSSGITSIFDMFFAPEAVAKACSDMGMRCVLVGAVNNFVQSTKEIGRLFESLNPSLDPLKQGGLEASNSLISFMLGFHGEYTCSKEILEEIAELSHKYKAPVFTHLAETKAEVEGCIARYGMTPTVFLDSLGMFDYGGGGYHCVHMTEEDISIFKNKKLAVVTNPGSNLKLASGIAPITEYLKQGIPVAIGTDGPASNNCLDMFREMYLVTGLAKVREQDASVVDAFEVLKMATVNGSRLMGQLNNDVLAQGKLADIIMIDLNQPNMQPLNNIAKNIVFSGSKSNIKMTMINGKILYFDREFLFDERVETIYLKANQITIRIKEELKFSSI